MKKLIFFALGALIVSSCSITSYSVETLEFFYDARMSSEQALALKSQVKIFTSEKEIEGDYEVLSLNTYSPAIAIPILYSRKAQMDKKFYQKAVEDAHEQGGNAILVVAGGTYKVLRLSKWDSDSETAAKYSNPIFNASIMEKLADGKLLKSPKSVIKRYSKMFASEIENNIKSLKTLDEVAFVREKVNVLEKFNNGLQSPDSKTTKEIAEYRISIDKKEKAINKKLAREQKK